MVQQSDPIGCQSAILHHAAQPPGESAIGDGIEGKLFYEGCLLSVTQKKVTECYERAGFDRQIIRSVYRAAM